MEFDFNLVNGIRYQEQNRAIIFSKNGEREFFYSIPPDLSRKAMVEDCEDYLSAKGFLKTQPPMTRWE